MPDLVHLWSSKRGMAILSPETTAMPPTFAAMELHPLNAISPIDGRYQTQTEPLAAWFSERALIRSRLLVELHWFRFLCELPLPQLEGADLIGVGPLEKRVQSLSLADALEVKRIEGTTNHDVKAVEYWLKDRLAECGLDAQKEFVHFGLTSQDINNTAIPLLLRDFTERHTCPPLPAFGTNYTLSRSNGRMCPCWLAPTASPPHLRAWERNSKYSANGSRGSWTCSTKCRSPASSVAQRAISMHTWWLIPNWIGQHWRTASQAKSSA
jgi:hypothetical protein